MAQEGRAAIKGRHWLQAAENYWPFMIFACSKVSLMWLLNWKDYFKREQNRLCYSVCSGCYADDFTTPQLQWILGVLPRAALPFPQVAQLGP